MGTFICGFVLFCMLSGQSVELFSSAYKINIPPDYSLAILR